MLGNLAACKFYEGDVVAAKAVLDHVDKEDREEGVTIRDAIGRDQKATFINESGLYSLILSSKLPQRAVTFLPVMLMVANSRARRSLNVPMPS